MIFNPFPIYCLMTTFLPMLHTMIPLLNHFSPALQKITFNKFYLPKKTVSSLSYVYLTSFLSVSLSCRLFVSLWSSLSVYWSVCLFPFPPTHLAHYYPAYKCLLVILPVLSVCLSMTPLVLSVCLPVCLINDMSVFLTVWPAAIAVHTSVCYP